MPTLRLVEVIHYVTDTVEERQRDKPQKTSHFVVSHRRALFDFRQTLHDARGGPCHHFTTQCFSGPVRAKKTEKSTPQPASNNNTGSAALWAVLSVMKPSTQSSRLFEGQKI